MPDQTRNDNWYMQRCFDLGRRGLGAVSPNPPVGALLVHDKTVLAEGFHAQFGGSHAEVNAVQNVPAEKRHLIPMSTLYVSLEPCCITGKTPPCTTLILKEGIRDVRIGTLDPNPAMSGKSVELLRSHGIKVTFPILQEDARHLIRSFKTNILSGRPHVVLKWAQSAYNISGIPGKQHWFSGKETQVWSHYLRATHDAILVGARTIETDNPSLTTRDYPGRSPKRVVYDPAGRLDQHYNVFANDGVQVYYFSKKINNQLSADSLSTVQQYLLNHNETEHASFILGTLFNENIGNIIIEGGAYVHQLFVKTNLWDEAWIVRTKDPSKEGILAPNVHGKLLGEQTAGPDTITGIRRE